MLEPIPKIGVGVFVLNTKGKFIVGQRKGSVGAGTWALPGGHLEFGESFETCAEREVLEETGLEVGDIYFLTATNDVMKAENKHYVTIFMACRIKEGSEKTQPEVMEPDKCEGWEWMSWEDIQALDAKEAAGEVGGRRLFITMRDLIVQRPAFNPAASIVQ